MRERDEAVIARNLRLAMGAYARSTEFGAAVDLGPAGAFSSGVDYPVFNATVLSEPVSASQFKEILDQSREFYRARGVGWSCWFDESMVDTIGGLSAVRLLESRGMRWVAEHDGMLTSRIRHPRRDAQVYVEVRPVADPQTRADFINVCSQVFLLPEEITRCIYGAPSFWNGIMRGWVGYGEQRPVCIAVSAADDRSIGLYSVGTMPGFRRRGYGEFITRHAIADAADRSGLHRWSLQSTPAGLKLYRHIGYEALSRITVWASR